MVKPGSYSASAIPRTQSSKAGNGWTEAEVAKAGFGLSYSGSVGAISLPKVLCRLRHHVCKQLDLHATNFLQVTGDARLSPGPQPKQLGSSHLRRPGRALLSREG